MSNQNNKPNMNMFNNATPEQQEMLKQLRTVPLIKHIVALLVGFLPMLVAIFLVGVDSIDIDFGQWQGITQVWEVSYGVMWVIAFSVVFFSVVVSSLLIKYNKDVKADVIPTVTAWSIMMFSLFIIPLPHKLLWLEVILVPIFALIGFIFGMIGVMFYSIIKFTKEMQKMQDVNGGVNPFEFNPNQPKPLNVNKPKVTKQPNQPKTKTSDDSIFKNEDNPFVDIEEDEE